MKRVPAPGARIVLTPDGRSVDTRHLSFTTSPHEECAVEEAIRIKERTGGSVTVLTLGPAEAEEQLRYSVSVGADQSVLIATDGSDWDPQATARAIAETVSDLEAAAGTFDLVLFGNESADAGGYQVGIRVARFLGRPMVNGVKAIEIAGTKLRARRPIEEGLEVLEMVMPAVVGVKEGINLPRYPTLPGRLRSKRAEVLTVKPIQRPGGLEMISLANPPEQVTETVVLGTGADAAGLVADLLEEMGLL